MITEGTEQHLVINPDCSIRVRTSNCLYRDGQKISSEPPHSRVIFPGDDLSKEDELLKALGAVLHTQKVIDKYLATLLPNKT